MSWVQTTTSPKARDARSPPPRSPRAQSGRDGGVYSLATYQPRLLVFLVSFAVVLTATGLWLDSRHAPHILRARINERTSRNLASPTTSQWLSDIWSNDTRAGATCADYDSGNPECSTPGALQSCVNFHVGCGQYLGVTCCSSKPSAVCC